MKPALRHWTALCLALAALTAAAVYGRVGAPAQPLLAFSFLLVCPGAGILGLLPRKDVLTPALLVITTSLVVDGIVAETLVLTRTWSPELALAILIGVSVAGLALSGALRNAPRSSAAPQVASIQGALAASRTRRVDYRAIDWSASWSGGRRGKRAVITSLLREFDGDKQKVVDTLIKDWPTMYADRFESASLTREQVLTAVRKQVTRVAFDFAVGTGQHTPARRRS
jgi:hypothetical protein